MTTHTPGPWPVRRVNFGVYHAGPAKLEYPGKEAIHYAAKSGVDLLARRLADAYLIAAAPNMLVALDYVLWSFECGDPVNLQIIRDAAALAEGRAP